MKTLRDAKIGDAVKVIKLHGEGAVRRRIMDMGITKNVEIFINFHVFSILSTVYFSFA
jgi:ferrous iron transport protein A